MGKDPAFPFYAQDFLTGVMHLTMEERGIYITLLSYQWAHNKIPIKRLRLIVGYDWDNISDEIKNKFQIKEDYLQNKRLEFEREKRAAFKLKQRENGKKGGRPKNPKETQSITQKKPLENEKENEKENGLIREKIIKNENKGKLLYDRKHLPVLKNTRIFHDSNNDEISKESEDDFSKDK